MVAMSGLVDLILECADLVAGIGGTTAFERVVELEAEEPSAGLEFCDLRARL